jgi:flagellar motility protein MotE (MotC chaperone)
MIKINILTQLNDKGLKQAQTGFAGLAKNTLLSSAALLTVGRFLVSATKAAAADEKSQALLAQQIRNTTGATNSQIREVEKFIARTQDSAAVVDNELRPALASLVRATGNVTESQELLGLALDISAGSGKSLESVTMALSRAANGNVTALTRLGIPLDQGAVKAKDFDKIAKDLSKTFAGQASAAANTFEGRAKKLSLALGDIKEEIGRFLIPVMADFVDAAIPVARALRKLADEADTVGFNVGKARFSFQNFVSVLTKRVALGPVIGQFVQLGKEVKNVEEELKEAKKAATAWSGSFPVMNETQKAFQNLKDQIAAKRDATKGAKKETENYADTLKGRMKDALIEARAQLTKATDDFTAFQTSISQSFTKDLSFASAEAAGEETGQGYIDGLVSQAQKIKTFGELTNRLITAGISEQALQQVLGAGLDAGTKIAQTLIDGGSDAITGPDGINQVVASVQTMADQIGLNAANNWYKSGVDNAKSYVMGVKKVLDSIDLTKIKTKKQLRQAMKSITAALEVPALAEGGITTGPTLALIGDNPGGREAVIPLNKLDQFGGGSNVTINVSGGDPQAVVDALRRYMYQNGTVPIRVSG